MSLKPERITKEDPHSSHHPRPRPGCFVFAVSAYQPPPRSPWTLDIKISPLFSSAKYLRIPLNLFNSPKDLDSGTPEASTYRFSLAFVYLEMLRSQLWPYTCYTCIRWRFLNIRLLVGGAWYECIGRSEDDFQELVLSFNPACFRDQIQVVSLGSKHLYPLSISLVPTHDVFPS